MFKTIALSGAEQEVKFSAKHQFFHFHNLGGGEVLASLQPGVTRSKDGILIVPSGGKGCLEIGSAADTVYVTGTGEIQIAGTGNAFSPFSSGVKGGGEVTSDNGAVSAVGTVDYPIVSLNLYGKSVQDTSSGGEPSGKNLLLNTLTSQTIDGITITVNKANKSITVNGTATDNVIKAVNSAFVFDANTNYILSGTPVPLVGGVYVGIIGGEYDAGTGAQILYDTTTTANISIVIQSGVTVNNAVFKPMIRLASVTDDTYEPYKGKPTPEHPIPIESVGDAGVEITASGKNLFDYSQITSKTSNGVTITNNNDGTFTFSGAKTDTTKTFSTSYSLTHEESVQLFSAGTYTISGVPKEYGGALYGYISLYYNGTNTYNFLSTRSTVTNTITADMLTDDFYVTFGFFSLANEDIPSDATIYMQVEKSAQETSFEAYKGNTAFVSSGMPLCSVGDIRDELVYNADGTGKIIKRVKIRRLLSDDNWSASGTSFYTTKYNDFMFISQQGYYNFTNAMCTHLVTTINEVMPLKTISMYYHSGYNGYRCFVKLMGTETLDEFKAFLDNNEVYVIYPLAEPQEIELSAEEMAELMQLQTYNGVTNIYNDEGAEMKVKVATNPLLSEFVNPVIDGITARYEARIAALESAVTNT